MRKTDVNRAAPSVADKKELYKMNDFYSLVSYGNGRPGVYLMDYSHSADQAILD